MKKLLGVTGCPTGIAHTFMAEEALKQAAGELGCQMKVETNGAIGVENPLIEVSVSEGINKARELVQRCLDGQPARMIFMIAAGEDGGDLHLKILSQMSKRLMHQDFVDAILKCSSKQKLVKLLQETE